ncbi:FAD-dependent oxidoreductase [Sphingomonas sp.]|uniref:FAD-dependent oxidoreductase n=1 Tax=Sphingomonas sp. TaxID=28214 RepID=UPI003CC6720B
MTPDRRTVIAGGTVAAAASAGVLALGHGEDAIPGTLSGANFVSGHRLRGDGFPAPTRTGRTRVAIVGGGIAGLAAGWALADANVPFTLLELEDRAGGNARAGRNAISAYPLGAHYLPIPNPEATGVLRLLERLGIVTGWDDGKPVFDPYQVVADPDERLLHLGRWRDGLVPAVGLTAADQADLHAFFAATEAFRHRIGRDGRPAFALPMEGSSRDPDLLALDRLSFTGWLHAQGWRSPVLHAHVRYSMRDDYGTEPQHVSAWAGIHYWAGRRGEAANVAGDAVLTWPEGNGHLAGRMAARLRDHIAPDRLAFRVAPYGDDVAVDSLAADGTVIRTLADAAILATPHFVTRRLLGRGAAARAEAGFDYAPWLVANVTVDRPPAGPGAALAWDNVSWTSDSLGYVVATHQSLDPTPGSTVLTWYMPLSTMPPAAARRELLARPLAHWQRIVRDDLLQTNPDLDGAIRRIDIWRWGHAMVRPAPGFFWSGAREAAAAPQPPLFFAHSDLSGLSLFEEAHYRGTRAAEDAMTTLGVAYTSTLV